MSSAPELKAETMAWLRYVKRMQAVCTELQSLHGNPDVVGVSPNTFIEVEVKVTLKDLMADFANKKTKMWRYLETARGNEHLSNKVPNYFFYMVTEAMAERALDIIREKFPKAGVIVYRPELGLLPGRNNEVIRGAEKLHSSLPTAQFLHEVFLRTSSELCGLRVAQVALESEVSKMLATVQTEVVGTARALRDDFLHATSQVDQLARNLAAASEKSWEDLPEAEKQAFKDTATRLSQLQRSEVDAWFGALGGRQ